MQNKFFTRFKYISITLNVQIILLILFQPSSSSETIYFITPQIQNCTITTCTGDILNPFDNILSALQANRSDINYTIILLPDPSHPHYLLVTENFPNGSIYYDYNGSKYIINGLTIRPLFCNEYPNQPNCLKNVFKVGFRAPKDFLKI